jgi:putative transposase
MPTRLHRFYGAKHLHFLTCSCYHRLPILGTAPARGLFLKILEETRRKYQFVVAAYVAMPEHFHLLISEPEFANPSVVMKVLKQRFARHVAKEGDESRIWQKRFYDFNVWSEKKRLQKVRYIHNNPVRRGLVTEPDQWQWSSYRSYAYREVGAVRINFQEKPAAIKMIEVQSFGQNVLVPTHFAKSAK